jgi:hypothetical protein
MHPPPLDPSVADLAPREPVLTPYDEEHLITYLRVLDADADNADWQEVARLVLHIDPVLEPNRARRAFDKSSRACEVDDQPGRFLLFPVSVVVNRFYCLRWSKVQSFSTSGIGEQS